MAARSHAARRLAPRHRGCDGAEPHDGPRPGPAGTVIYWHVDDVSAAIDRLVALGAMALEAPRDFGEGFIGATVVDPFGNILGVMYNPHYLEILATMRPAS